jgi:hypothetical protein
MFSERIARFEKVRSRREKLKTSWNGVQSLQGKLSDDDCLRPGS